MSARFDSLPEEWVRQAEQIAELSSKAGRPIAMKEFAAEVFPGMAHGQMRRRLQALRQRGLILPVHEAKRVMFHRKPQTLKWTAGPVLLGDNPRSSVETWRPPLEHAIHLVALALQMKQQMPHLEGEELRGACNGWQGALDFAVEEFVRAIECDPRLVRVRRAGENAQQRRGRVAAGVA